MSFILDALKKSQRERSLSDVPSLHTQYVEPQENKFWRRLLISILILVLIVALVFIFRQPLLQQAKKGIDSLQTLPQTDHETVSMPSPAMVAAEPVSTAPIVEEKPENSALTDEESINKNVPESEPVTTTNNSEVVQSQKDRAMILRLRQSLKVNVVSWSPLAEKRFVMINQQIYHEGSSLPGGFHIVEITADGPRIAAGPSVILISP